MESVFRRLRTWLISGTLRGVDLLVSLLPKDLKLVLLSSVARALGVDRIVADGALGEVTGRPWDLSVMGDYLKHKAYSKTVTGAIQAFFEAHPQGVFIDIGANIGLTAIAAARAGAHCILFEPEPGNLELLRRNTSGLDVVIHPVAAFDRSTELNFSIARWNLGDHRISPSGDASADRQAIVTVRADRVDDLVGDLADFDGVLVKIDVQGAEVAALRGAQALLARADKAIIEFTPYLIRRAQEEPMEFVDMICRHFHKASIANMKGATAIPAADPIDVVRDTLTEFQSDVTSTMTLDIFAEKSPPDSSSPTASAGGTA